MQVASLLAISVINYIGLLIGARYVNYRKLFKINVGIDDLGTVDVRR